MRIYKTDQIRNITLIGNSGSGKTTLAEAMLFEGGVINRRGDIVHKNTVSDYQIIEQEYQNSVYSTLLYTEYNDKKTRDGRFLRWRSFFTRSNRAGNHATERFKRY